MVGDCWNSSDFIGWIFRLKSIKSDLVNSEFSSVCLNIKYIPPKVNGKSQNSPIPLCEKYEDRETDPGDDSGDFNEN